MPRQRGESSCASKLIQMTQKAGHLLGVELEPVAEVSERKILSIIRGLAAGLSATRELFQLWWLLDYL